MIYILLDEKLRAEALSRAEALTIVGNLREAGEEGTFRLLEGSDLAAAPSGPVSLPYIEPIIDAHGQVTEELHIPVAVTSMDRTALRKGMPQDAGFDLRANIGADKEHREFIAPGLTRRIATDLRIKIPAGYYARIVGRSSLHDKGLVVIEGIIDAGFTGELYVRVMGVSFDGAADDQWQLADGEWFAQLLFAPIVPVVWHNVNELVSFAHERGERGHGSTGK